MRRENSSSRAGSKGIKAVTLFVINKSILSFHCIMNQSILARFVTVQVSIWAYKSSDIYLCSGIVAIYLIGLYIFQVPGNLDVDDNGLDSGRCSLKGHTGIFMMNMFIDNWIKRGYKWVEYISISILRYSCTYWYF